MLEDTIFQECLSILLAMLSQFLSKLCIKNDLNTNGIGAGNKNFANEQQMKSKLGIRKYNRAIEQRRSIIFVV